MTEWKLFADDAASLGIGELTVENGTDRLAVYGSLDVTRDKQGLAQARRLKALLDQVVHVLESDPHLSGLGAAARGAGHGAQSIRLSGARRDRQRPQPASWLTRGNWVDAETGERAPPSHLATAAA